MGPRNREVQSNMTDNESAKIKSSKGVIQEYSGRAVADDKNQSRTIDCSKCPLREKCFRRNTDKAKNRTLYIVDTGNGPNYSKEMRDKIDRPEIRDLYSKRMGIIVF